MQLLERTCNFDRMNVQRIFARGFVIVGGLFWAFAAFFQPYGNRTIPILTSVGYSVAVLVLTIAVFLIGWFYEYLAAALLLVGAAGIIVYGIIGNWDVVGVWGPLAMLLIGPMIVAGLLFLLAAQMQNVCSLKDKSKTA